MKKEEVSVVEPKVDNRAEIQALLEKNLEISQKNLELSEEILTKVKYIKRYIFWKKVMAIIIWILIILSTVASVYYLPILMNQLQGQVKSMVTPGLLGF